uniref:DUF1907 domain-containing protein n=1 Tax=Balaenoptera musculus TaxID=9771 RepID=A0A8C0HVC3_BALMU
HSCVVFCFGVWEVGFGVQQKGLTDNFADVQASVVDCPNWTKEPFTFPVKGICGKTRIAEVGGVPYLLPLINKKKVYDLNKIAEEIQLPGAFVLGAGAGPFQTLGFNSEFMPVVQTESEHKPPVNGSYFAPVNSAEGGCLLEKYSEKYHDLGCALLANLFASEAQPGKIHIMPAEFSSCPLNSDEDLNKWLRFYEMKDPGFDLWLEHTHCLSHHEEGGHYHFDTTPVIVEYLGYFLPAEFLYCIDQPTETHSFGRD